MKVFWTTLLILLCIAFSLMSACFGFFGVMMLGSGKNNLAIAAVWLGIFTLFGVVAFFCGRAAKKMLAQTTASPDSHTRGTR